MKIIQMLLTWRRNIVEPFPDHQFGILVFFIAVQHTGKLSFRTRSYGLRTVVFVYMRNGKHFTGELSFRLRSQGLCTVVFVYMRNGKHFYEWIVIQNDVSWVLHRCFFVCGTESIFTYDRMSWNKGRYKEMAKRYPISTATD